MQPMVPIDDGGALSTAELASAMTVQEAPELDAQGEDNFAESFGLRYHEGGSIGPTSSMHTKPGVLEGKRGGRQVFIRIGWLGDGPPVFFTMLRRKRLRYVTVVRVEAPEFRLSATGGELTGDGMEPGSVAELIGALSRAPDVWRDMKVVSGADGIVATRKVPQRVAGGIGEWIYDLWLGERLAGAMGAKALPDKTLRRNWTVPYGLGERLPD